MLLSCSCSLVFLNFPVYLLNWWYNDKLVGWTFQPQTFSMNCNQVCQSSKLAMRDSKTCIPKCLITERTAFWNENNHLHLYVWRFKPLEICSSFLEHLSLLVQKNERPLTVAQNWQGEIDPSLWLCPNNNSDYCFCILTMRHILF